MEGASTFSAWRRASSRALSANLRASASASAILPVASEEEAEDDDSCCAAASGARILAAADVLEPEGPTMLLEVEVEARPDEAEEEAGAGWVLEVAEV